MPSDWPSTRGDPRLVPGWRATKAGGRWTLASMSHKPTRDPARPNGRAQRRRRKVTPESRFPRQFALLLAVVLTALLPVASAAAGTAKPFASVQQTQT